MPYNHFTSEERDALQTMLSYRLSLPEIARIIGKHRSSIHREIKRNSLYDSYLGHLACRMARARRRQNKPSPKRANERLMARVEELLHEDASPEQISGRISLEQPKDSSWHISYETIYKYIYGHGERRQELITHLRQGHKKRRKRATGKARRGTIPGRVSIDERPGIVDKKLRFGDWEGDTIEGKGKRGYIATFTDRKSKYLVAFKIPNKTAALFTSGTIKALSKIPKNRLRTITFDNGKENAFHKQLSVALGVKVYFAHAYHSWERGLNEHTNGLLRQYFPKFMPLDLVHHHTLDKAVKALNNRPRKCLGYRTPHEVFFNLPVALQT